MTSNSLNKNINMFNYTLLKTTCKIYLLLGVVSISHAEILSGLVVGITDGDTITLLDSSNQQYKIRLSGIDAPEKKQAFGNVSKKFLSDLIYDKNVSVEYYKNDRYGRLVGKVLLNDLNVNLEQVKHGMAWHFAKYKKEQPFNDRLTYVQAQQEAQNNKIGLWLDPNPKEPWEFRRKFRSKDSSYNFDTRNL